MKEGNQEVKKESIRKELISIYTVKKEGSKEEGTEMCGSGHVKISS